MQFSLFDNIKRAIPYGEIQKSAKEYMANSQPKIRAFKSMFENMKRSAETKTAFVEAACCDYQELITDKAVNIGSTFSDNVDLVGDISEDTAKAIIDTFGSICESSKYTAENAESYINSFIVSSSDGFTYQFVKFDQPYHLPDSDILVYIATCEQPRTIYDCLVYTQAGVYKYNPLLRTSDYNWDVADLTYDSILDGVTDLCFFWRLDAPSSVLDGLHKLLPKYGIGEVRPDDIYTHIHSICYEKNIDFDGTINDGMAKIYQWTKEHYISEHIGRVTTIYDLTEDVAESSALDDAMLKVFPVVLAGQNAEAAISSLKDESYTKYSSVRSFVDGAQDAMASGSLLGLVDYILGYGKAAQSLSDDNGHLTFTNNADYVPQEFIVGIIGSFLTTVGSIAGAVGNVWGKIFGAITMVAGSICSGIAKSMEYQYDKSVYAQIVSDTTVIFPMAPLATWQTMISSTSPFISEAKKYIDIDNYFYVIEVPGGFILTGKGSDTQYAFEFHPSLENHIPLAKYLVDHCSFSKVAYSGGRYTYANLEWDNGFDPEEQISELYNDDDYIGSDKLINEDISDDSSVMSSTKDRLAREIVVANTFIFNMFYAGFLDFVNLPAYAIISDSDGSMVLADGQIARPVDLSYLYIAMYKDDFIPEWTVICSDFDLFASGDMGTANLLVQGAFASLFIYKRFIGDITPLESSAITYCLRIPKYNRKTFWLYIAAAVAITIGMAAFAVKKTMSIKRWQRQKAAQNSRDCEAAWERYKTTGSAEDQAAYFKTVKKNNRMTKLTGGTKYSKQGFWASTDSGASPDTNRNASNFLSQLYADNAESNSNATILDISRLIIG